MKYKIELTSWRLRSGRVFGKTWIRFILRFKNKSKWKYIGKYSKIKKENLKRFRFSRGMITN